MSDDARIALTLICSVVGLLAQLGGLLLVVRETRKASRLLRRWSQAGTGAGQPDLRDVVGAWLDNPYDRVAAAVLLVLGVALGGFCARPYLLPRGPPPPGSEGPVNPPAGLRWGASPPPAPCSLRHRPGRG